MLLANKILIFKRIGAKKGILVSSASRQDHFTVHPDCHVEETSPHQSLSHSAAPLRINKTQDRTACTVRAASTDELSTPQTAALVSGAIFNPIVLYSEYILFTTGKGLDPGPAGIYGALEGVGKFMQFKFHSVCTFMWSSQSRPLLL